MLEFAMQSREVLVNALTALCAREGGYHAVAAEAHVSADNLWQILHGTLLPSGKPRSVGARLAAKLDARYPGWMNAQYAPKGVQLQTVAREVSHPPNNTQPMPANQVPVIGTLEMGEESMFELRSLTDGKPIGQVPALSDKPGTHAVRVFGDNLYPAVRHGAVLVVDPNAPAVEGELALLETMDGYYLICELVAARDDTITVMPANGGQRKTFARSTIAACMPVCDIIPGHRFQPSTSNR
jgi:SOS-response transcriptional repressor LexA